MSDDATGQGKKSEATMNVANGAAANQTGQFYCSGCGRKFRYTHEGYAVCLTSGCQFSGRSGVTSA